MTLFMANKFILPIKPIPAISFASVVETLIWPVAVAVHLLVPLQIGLATESALALPTNVLSTINVSFTLVSLRAQSS